MTIKSLEIQYLAHVCFLFRSPEGGTVLTDPMWAAEFPWQGHVERYLSPPDVKPEDIPRCDAVFVSHVHGDHFDPDAVAGISWRTGAKVWAPAEVVEVLAGMGLPSDRLVPLTEGAELSAPGFSAVAMAGYDDSLDEKGRANKFSLLLRGGGAEVFYSGDCHQPPPAMSGRKVDAVFSWPHQDDAKLAAFVSAFQAERFVLMHGDRFEPGDFLCNLDLEEEKERLERLLPGMEVIAPEREK